jgi:hypothetical protein
VNWDQNDLVVVQEALKSAMANESDYQAILTYQEVLDKITQGDINQAKGANVAAQQDGFRYDYDDASDLY